MFIELTFFGLEWVVGRKIKINKILYSISIDNKCCVENQSRVRRIVVMYWEIVGEGLLFYIGEIRAL